LGIDWHLDWLLARGLVDWADRRCGAAVYLPDARGTRARPL
jgi:hypothetical protein